MGRRDDLTEQACDYALEHGLFGLSLRPLAEALGTSDRMLLYHFGTKNDLMAAILRTSNDRSVASIQAMEGSPDVRTAVTDLWAAWQSPPIVLCSRLYVEASALGLFGSEPFATSMKRSNADWRAAVSGHFVKSGLPDDQAGRIADLVDVALMGLLLDEQLDGTEEQQRALADLADAAALLTETWS